MDHHYHLLCFADGFSGTNLIRFLQGYPYSEIVVLVNTVQVLLVQTSHSCLEPRYVIEDVWFFLPPLSL